MAKVNTSAQVETLRVLRDTLSRRFTTATRMNAACGQVGGTTQTHTLLAEIRALDDVIQEAERPEREAGEAAARREKEERQEQYDRETMARVEEADVYQRRNGWEIVKDGRTYVLRHPGTREEVYRHWKLSRVREVASESAPEEK